jgi:PAS domain S-box-containing protein
MALTQGPAADDDIGRLRSELAEARHSVAWLRAILESARDYAILTIDSELKVTSWNVGAVNVLGWSEAEAVGMDARLTFTPEDRAQGVPEAECSRAAADGRSEDDRWHLRHDGSRFWASGVMLPLRGAPKPGFVKILRDRTDQREADERQTLLLRELAHRVKNMLALISSMARQTGGRARDLDGFLELFEGRLLALAAAHELLTDSGWSSVSLPTLIAAALAPHGDQIAVQTDELMVLPSPAQNLVLVLHELATNAAKHGALLARDGRVEVEARVSADELLLTWRESGGQSVQAPLARGFGTTLLEQIIARQHRGRIDLDWRSEGLHCTIALPLSEVRATARPLEHWARGRSDPPPV